MPKVATQNGIKKTKKRCSADALDLKKVYASRTKAYKCEHCFLKYKSPQALGGHQSKAHPGQSSTYSLKLLKRKEREPERMMLQEAKDLY